MLITKWRKKGARVIIQILISYSNRNSSTSPYLSRSFFYTHVVHTALSVHKILHFLVSAVSLYLFNFVIDRRSITSRMLGIDCSTSSQVSVRTSRSLSSNKIAPRELSCDVPTNIGCRAPSSKLPTHGLYIPLPSSSKGDVIPTPIPPQPVLSLDLDLEWSPEEPKAFAVYPGQVRREAYP